MTEFANLHVFCLMLFSVTEGDMSALIHVGPQNPREYTDVLSTTEPLAPLSEEGRGKAVGRDVSCSVALTEIAANRVSCWRSVLASDLGV